MAPPPYAKKENAELDDLLQLRGVEGGTKLEKMARLLKQDQEDETARKMTEARIRAASGGVTGNTNAPAVQRRDSAPEVSNRNSLNAAKMGRANRQVKRTGSGSVGLAQQDGEVGRKAESHDAYIRSLMTGSAATSTSDARRTKDTDMSSSIVVNMTPEKALRTTSSNSTTPRFRQVTAKANGLQMSNEAMDVPKFVAAETSKQHGAGRWGYNWATFGVILVLLGILMIVLLMVAGVNKWW